MTVVVEDRGSFTLENLRRVTVDGEGVRIGETARGAMAHARDAFQRLLDSDRTAFIYGTTSPPGQRAREPIAPDRQLQFAREMARSRGRGWGFGEPALEPRVVRGIVFARLTNFVEGHAACRPELAERIAAQLDGPLPVVPLDGQVSGGEVLALAHVLRDMPAEDLVEGEPMALINGAPCAAALAGDAALHASHRWSLAVDVFALAIDAFQAPLDAYDERLDALYGDEDERAALRALRRRLQGAGAGGRRAYQAPVSFRIAGRVLAAAGRAVRELERTAATSLRAVTANPVFLLPTPERPLGAAISTGGYHDGAAYPALNALSAAWADLCVLADRQVTTFHEPAVSGLPPMLAAPGSDAPATGGLGFAIVGHSGQARHAAQRTHLPASEGGGYAGQNDVALPTFPAYAQERAAAAALERCLAILAVVASQALWVTGRDAAPPLRELLETVRSHVAPMDGTRPRDGEPIGVLAAALHAAGLSGTGIGVGAR